EHQLQPDPPEAARGREHPHHPRGGGRVSEPGHALLDRQGQRGHGAPGPEGVPPRPPAVPADAREHDVEVPRDDRVPRPILPRVRLRPDRARQPRGPGGGGQPVRLGLEQVHDGDEDRGAQAGAEQARLRRRVRRRPPRRGEEPGQGAGLQLPRPDAPVGPEEPAARAVEPVQRQGQQGREHPRLPAQQLDRARRLAVHPPREHPDRPPLLRGRAPGRLPRRHDADGRRRADEAAARRKARDEKGPLS
ncbi:MAG: Sulfate adenylyltransferase subunit 2, partial [uncultured Phycisphaerae bacterium]